MSGHTQSLVYLFTGVNGKRTPIYVGLWRMETEIEVNRVHHLIAVDFLSFMDMAQRKDIWLTPWMYDEQPYLALLWTEAVDSELVEVLHVMIEDNYHGKPCSVEDTDTLLLVDEVVSLVKEKIRRTREQGARN